MKMNIVLDAFERVLYPAGAARRASSSGGLVVKSSGGGGGRHHHHHQHHQNQQQHGTAANNRRRKSGCGNNGHGHFAQQQNQQSSLAPSDSFALLFASGGCNSTGTTTTPLTSCIMAGHQQQNVLEQQQQQQNGGREGTQSAGNGTPRSRSSTTAAGSRKKSACPAGGPRKQSIASILLSVLSSPASTSSPAQRRAKSSCGRHAGPPRQWSVPERHSRQSSTEERSAAEGDDEPPFCLVTSSSVASSSVGRTPPRQLSGDDGGASPLQQQQQQCSLSPLATPCSFGQHPLPASPSSAVLLGFVPAAQLRPPGFRVLGRSSDLPCLDDWSSIRAQPTVSQALFLRCVDPEPAFSFVHCATIEGPADALQLAEELGSIGNGEFGCFEELFALQRATMNSAGGGGMTATAGHQGLILVCFRLLDEDNGRRGRAELESSWLSWTGAGQIYRYSPRAWALRRLCLLRRLQPQSPSSGAPFAYVLLCEFGAILHPSNALGALDMCERLRTRNCGLVALYKVRHSFVPQPSSSRSPSPAAAIPSAGLSSLSPHWSPLQMRRVAAQQQGQLGRMGRSQEEDWNGHNNSSRRRRETLLLMRARERSLGWEAGGARQSAAHGSAHNQQQQWQWQGQPGLGTEL